MPRPQTKTALLEASTAQYGKLLQQIDTMTPVEQEADFPPGTLNRNIRDILAHLHHWHKMMLEWYDIGMQGKKPDMPAKGYTWKTTPDLNRWIQQQYANQPLATIRHRFADSHRQVHQLIEQHSDEELFTKKRYGWTGSTSLGAYLVSATSSHYDWAIKLIKRVQKQRS